MKMANFLMPKNTTASQVNDEADVDPDITSVGEVAVRRGPIGEIAVGGAAVVVTNFGDDTVSLLNATTLAVQHTVAVDGERELVLPELGVFLASFLIDGEVQGQVEFQVLLQQAPAALPKEIEDGFRGRGYADFKSALTELVIAKIEPIRTRYLELTGDRAELEKLVALGAERARGVAEGTMETVWERTGLGRRPDGR